MSPEQQEIQRLRKENEILRQGFWQLRGCFKRVCGIAERAKFWPAVADETTTLCQ